MQEEEFRRNCELRAKDEPVTNQQAIEALDHIVKNPRRDAEDTRTLNQAVSVLENFIYIHAGAEINRLTAECQKWQEYHDAEYRERKKYRQDANYFAGEVDRLRAELKGREAEVEKLTHERDLWENMAAMRLADQEAIERHITKRVAGECAEIAETFRTPYGTHPLLSGVQIGSAIRKKYGVE
jgi:predicted RNase H-like nuclease (RuvC/YqgF family)